MTVCKQDDLFSEGADNQNRFHDLVNRTEFIGETSSPTDQEYAVLEDKAIALDQYDKLGKLETLENKKQNRELRKDFAYKAYDMAMGCISFWIIIVSGSAIVKFVTGREFLTDTAIGIITTGVTINVFTALLTVIKGLFSNIEE